MRVLAYEARRLRGLRSTWLILTTVMLADAAVAALLARQTPGGPLTPAAALRAATAAVPLLPLPIAALGAGALGALSYGHEVRHQGLPAARVALWARVRLVAGKLVVIGGLSGLLALATLLLDGLVLRLALPVAVDPSALLDAAAVRAAVPQLAAFAALVALGGCAGLLTTSLVRNAAAGLLILCALPAALEPAVGLVLRQAGRDWPAELRELMPFQYGLDWVRGNPEAARAPLDGPLLAALLAPVVLLLLCSLLVQLRRRAL